MRCQRRRPAREIPLAVVRAGHAVWRGSVSGSFDGSSALVVHVVDQAHVLAFANVLRADRRALAALGVAVLERDLDELARQAELRARAVPIAVDLHDWLVFGVARVPAEPVLRFCFVGGRLGSITWPRGSPACVGQPCGVTGLRNCAGRSPLAPPPGLTRSASSGAGCALSRRANIVIARIEVDSG
jgi:hypothetical protein